MKKITLRQKKDMKYFIVWLFMLMMFIFILLYSVKVSHIVGAVISVLFGLLSFAMCVYYIGNIERARLQNGKKNKSY